MAEVADGVDHGADEVRADIVGGAFGGDVWDDKAADAGRDYVEGLLRGMRMSRDDLESAANALKKLGRVLGDAKHLAAANAQRAEAGGLQVDPVTGLVTVPSLSAAEVERRGGKTAAEAYQQKRFDLADDCNSGILEALDEASDADRETALTLATLGKPLPTVRKLNARADKMEQRAEEAAELASKVRSLTDEQLERLRDLMAFADDPAFATTLHRQLGAEGTLLLGGQLASKAMGAGISEDDLEMLADIQAQLGVSLATATDPANMAHVTDSWQQNLLDHVGQKVDIGLEGYQPYGHQILGALMDTGDYSEQFLTAVGKDMYDFERAHGGSSIWAQNTPHGAMYNGFSLNLNNPSKTGAGFDPMTGLMEAMSGNENAAEQFFDPKAHPGRIDYLLTDRTWFPDLPEGEMIPRNYQSPGINDLGSALDAAATGDRDASSARIMAETVHRLATDDDMDLPASMRDSMGHMVSMWIDDVNKAAAGSVEANPQAPLTYDLTEGFLSNQDHAYFEKSEIFEVMREAAKDPDAYQEMWDHQRAYTAGLLEYEATHGNDTATGIQTAAMTSGQVFDKLTEAKGDAIAEIAAAHDARHNAQAERMGAVANFVVGEVAGRIPVAGPAVGAAGGWYVDTLVENSKIDTMPLARDQVTELYSNTNQNLKDLVKDVMYRHEIGEGIPQDSPLRREDGSLIPRALMTSDQIAEFNSYVSDKNEQLGRALQEIDQSFPPPDVQ